MRSRRKPPRVAPTRGGFRNKPSSALGRFWQRYQDEPRYQTSPFPFPRRRMTLFDKLHSDFISLVSIVGAIWLAVLLIRYLVI